MRTSTLAALTALLLFIAGLIAVTSPGSMRFDTTAMLDTAQAPPEDGAKQEQQPESSTAETKAYIWLAKFALAKFK